MTIEVVITKNGNTISSESTGTLHVIKGKCRPSTQKLKKDTIDGGKKGDDVSGMEFILELADKGNFIFKNWVQEPGNNGKTYAKLQACDPAPFPLVASFFIPGEIGKAYKCIFDKLEDFKLPLNLADGFKGVMDVGENKHTALLAASDLSKGQASLATLLDDVEAVECNLEFPIAKESKGNYGGNSAQAESDRIKDRVAFINSALTENSDVEQAFIKIAKHDDKFTFIDFISLILG